MKERGLVTFQLGGVQQRVFVNIGVSVAIEEATGVGVIRLVQSFLDGSAQFRHAVEVLRCVLADNGKVYETRELVELSAAEGIPAVLKAASQVLNALFVKPKGLNSGKSPAGSENPATTSTR